MKECILVLTVSVILCGCAQNRLKNDIRNMMGRDVVFASDICLIEGADSICKLKKHASATIVFWYDSTDCSFCCLDDVFSYSDIISYCVDTLSNSNIIFIFSPVQKECYEFVEYASSLNYDIPIMVDTCASFSYQNPHLPSNKDLHVFLMDRNNCIKLAGHPYMSDKLWSLYRKTMYDLESEDTIDAK